MTLACLPMYDLPEARAALDALWAGVARQLGRHGVADVPALDHEIAAGAAWSSPGLQRRDHLARLDRGQPPAHSVAQPPASVALTVR